MRRSLLVTRYSILLVIGFALTSGGCYTHWHYVRDLNRKSDRIKENSCEECTQQHADALLMKPKYCALCGKPFAE